MQCILARYILPPLATISALGAEAQHRNWSNVSYVSVEHYVRVEQRERVSGTGGGLP